jgi:hypothetical protein
MNLSTMLNLRAVGTSLVDQSAIKGEAGTGYESGSKGPFRCDNCEYFYAGACSQMIMCKMSRLSRDAGGMVKVDPAGCCEYIDRK